MCTLDLYCQCYPRMLIIWLLRYLGYSCQGGDPVNSSVVGGPGSSTHCNLRTHINRPDIHRQEA